MASIPVVHFPPPYGPRARLTTAAPLEVEHGGQAMLALPIPTKQGDAVLLTREAHAVAALFDGTRDLRGVQRAVHEQFGQLVHVERIHSLAISLFRAGLLVREPA